jgi:hypothetical protein
MAIDFTKPATTDNYSTAFVPNIQANQTALAQWLDSTNTTITGTPPTYAKRYNRASGLIEEYSGSAWGALSMGYVKKAGDQMTGNLGIGITPTQALDVNGIGRFGNSGSGFDPIIAQSTNSVDVRLQAQGGSSIASVGTASNHPFYLFANGTEWMRVGTTGLVGIGTTSSTERLVVQGAIRATSNSAAFGTGAEGAFMDFVPGSVVRIGHVAGASGSARPLTFYINSSEVARVDATGNLLVGSTSASLLSGAGRGLIELNGSTDSVYSFKKSGTVQGYTYMDSSGNIHLNSAAGTVIFEANNAMAMTISTAGVITDKNGIELGWKNIPTSSQASGALTNECRGKLIKATGGVTINTSVFADGDTFSIYNTTGASITVTQGASVTLELAGTATTGSRTLATKGLMTVRCYGANFSTAGAGVS